jgi:glucokinase
MLTNLDWILDAMSLQSRSSIKTVIFINDIEAAALGSSRLTIDSYIILNNTQPQDKAIKVVTGTGLDLAWLNYEKDHCYANTSEGGHLDFAPVTIQQISLLKELMSIYSHVSYERLLPGEGLEAIYNFLKQSKQDIKSASEITQNTLNGNGLAKKVISLFVEIYGAYIGNLAMLFKPAGGIYIAGGIASELLSWMQSKTFIEAFKNKGRTNQIVMITPIYLVNNEYLGLQGAMSVGM